MDYWQLEIFHVVDEEESLMVYLNDNAKEYMQKYGWRHVVLNVEEITSWCAPPYLEVSVSFTDEDEETMRGKGYTADQSELGNVYYPAEGIARDEKVSVNYVEYPWITCFEVEGFTIPQKEEE